MSISLTAQVSELIEKMNDLEIELGQNQVGEAAVLESSSTEGQRVFGWSGEI